MLIYREEFSPYRETIRFEWKPESHSQTGWSVNVPIWLPNSLSRKYVEIDDICNSSDNLSSYS